MCISNEHKQYKSHVQVFTLQTAQTGQLVDLILAGVNKFVKL